MDPKRTIVALSDAEKPDPVITILPPPVMSLDAGARVVMSGKLEDRTVTVVY